MKSEKLRALCEGAIMVALAQVLGYLKFYELPYGGSVTLAMIPILFYCVRWGARSGFLAAFSFGLLQLLMDGAYAYTWQAMILDYILAFGVLGIAGFFRQKRGGLFLGSVLAIFLRFICHTLSGVYVWAEYMPERFMGMPMTSPWVYSPIYNGIYMGFNLLVTLIAFAILYRPLGEYADGKKL